MDLTTARAQLDAWLDADLKIAAGQSVSIEDASITRADAAEVTRKIQYWQSVVSRLERQAGGDQSPGLILPSWQS